MQNFEGIRGDLSKIYSKALRNHPNRDDPDKYAERVRSELIDLQEYKKANKGSLSDEAKTKLAKLIVERKQALKKHGYE